MIRGGVHKEGLLSCWAAVSRWLLALMRIWLVNLRWLLELMRGGCHEARAD